MSHKIIAENESPRVSAAVGGRRLTLDPISTFSVSLEIREVESTIPCGFQATWGTVDVDGNELHLTAGAGMGNGWGTISFRGKRYIWAIGDLAAAFLDHVNKEVTPE